jgi:predicted  nucleic acid-binding Zn-ribbon protein
MEGLFDYKTTGAYKILLSLQGDNTIDSETFVKYLNKLAKVHQYSMSYMHTEKNLSTSLKKLREDNTRTLNEYSELQKQQSELMELINRTSEECRKTKAELSEYENSRLLKKQWAIDRLYEQIDKLKREIDNKEKEQLENLKRQIEKIQEEINEKVASKEKLEMDIAKTNQRSKDMQNLKDKIDFNNEKSIIN